MPPKQPGKRKDGDSGVGAEIGDTGTIPKQSGQAKEGSSSSDDDDPQARIQREKDRRAAEERTRREARRRELDARRAEEVRLVEEEEEEEVRREEEARGRATPEGGVQGAGQGAGEDQDPEDAPPAPAQAPPAPPGPPGPPGPAGQAWDADEDDAIMAGARVNANQLSVMGEFKGDGDDIELFVMQVIRCKEAFDWNDAVTSQLVQTSLKGQAAKWLRSLLKTQTNDQHLNVWDHRVVPANAAPGALPERVAETGFRHYLLTRFREVQNGQAAVEAVADLKQRGSETVDDFYDRILLAMDRKNYTSTEAVKETDEYKQRLLVDAFIFLGAGLKDELRKVVSVQVPAAINVAQLLERARAAELVRRKDKTPSYLNELSEGESADSTTGESAEAGPEEEGAAALPTLAEMRLELEALKKNMFRGAADVECWNCHQMGHFSYECQTKRTIAPRGRGGRNGAGGRGRRPAAGAAGAARGQAPAAGGRGRGRGRGRAPPQGRRRLFVVDADGYLDEEFALDQLDEVSDGLDYEEGNPDYDHPNE